jgi:7,8-dihydropterin-6-yl-methyl-4-(beta-D-ribofuranosyl)aminobenzene 5'-phosphate synthase
MKVSGIEKVHAIAGGFHLAPQKEDYVRQTVSALKEINPDVVIPMHCTGDVFIDVLRQEMPEKFIRSYTGSTYYFGA